MQSAFHEHGNKPLRSPGTEGIWTFVFIDMIIFLLIFFTFMMERMRQLDVYVTSQTKLNEFFGLSNTLILLTSSWLVVEAIQSVRKLNVKKAGLYLNGALLFGMAFSVNKIIEYSSKLSVGITPATNAFFSFYYFITIVHFLHVIVGMLIILYFRFKVKSALTSKTYLPGLENIGLFWHYVDILWIFIFPLLYLVGRQ